MGRTRTGSSTPPAGQLCYFAQMIKHPDSSEYSDLFITLGDRIFGLALRVDLQLENIKIETQNTWNTLRDPSFPVRAFPCCSKESIVWETLEYPRHVLRYLNCSQKLKLGLSLSFRGALPFML